MMGYDLYGVQLSNYGSDPLGLFRDVRFDPLAYNPDWPMGCWLSCSHI